MLLGFAAFALLHKGVLKAGKSLSTFVARSGRKLIRQFAPESLRKGFSHLQSSALKSANRFQRLSGAPPLRRVDLTLGQLLQPLGKDLLSNLSSRSQTFRSVLDSGSSSLRQVYRERARLFRDIGFQGAERRRVMSGEIGLQDMDMRRKFLGRYFKPDGGFTKRFMGSALSWSGRYAKSVPGFYAADQALGLFTQEESPDRPAFYDIPGHIGGMIRFGITFAPMDLAFRGALSGGKYGKDFVAERARKYFAARPETRGRAIRALSRDGALGHIASYAKAFSRSYVERKRYGWGVGLDPVRFDGRAYDIPALFRRAMELSKQTGKSTTIMESQMQQMLDQIHSMNLSNTVDPGTLQSMAASSEIRRAFSRVIDKHTRAPKKNMLSHALDLKARKTSTFEFIDQYAEKAGWSEQTKDSVRTLLGGKDLYFGNNVFQQGNLSLLSGQYMVQKAIATMGKFRIPLINWSPFQRLAFQRLSGPVDVFEEGAGILTAETSPKVFGTVEVKSPQRGGGEVFLRIGDSLFSVAPFRSSRSVKPLVSPEIGSTGEMLHLSSGQKAAISSMVPLRSKRSTGWLSRFRNTFELGYGHDFVGGSLRRWALHDRAGSNPRVVLGKIQEMMRNINTSISSDEFIDFEKYVDKLGRHLGSVDRDAFSALEGNASLRNSLLDQMGVPRERRFFGKENAESLYTVIKSMIGNVVAMDGRQNLRRGPWNPRIESDFSKALKFVDQSVDRGYAWEARASVLGKASSLTVREWLEGEYFKQLIYDSRYAHQRLYPEGILGETKIVGIDKDTLKDVFGTVGKARLSARDDTSIKSLFTGISIDMNLRKMEATDLGPVPIARFESTRKVLLEHLEAIDGVFNKKFVGRSLFRDIEESTKSMAIPGGGSADNRLFLISHGQGRKNITPGLLEELTRGWNREQGGRVQSYVTKNSLRFDSWAIRPLNRALSVVGLDLAYTSNAEFIRKFIFKRALAIPAAIYGYRALNATLAAVPWLNNTILDDGLTVAAADVVASANTARAGLFDTMGVTAAARYLEGLMPGSVESPAAKIIRGALPPLLGRKIGGGGGFAAGLAVSAITGFGLPDLTKTKEELEDVYAGRELTMVRSGRFWEGCIVSDTPLRTLSGLRNAEDINIGDRVITALGNVGRVVDKSARPLSEGEIIYEMEPLCLPSMTIKCTSDHQLLVDSGWKESRDIILDEDYLVYPLPFFQDGEISPRYIPGMITDERRYLLGKFIAIYLACGYLEDGRVDFLFSLDRVGVATQLSFILKELYAAESSMSISQSKTCKIVSTDHNVIHALSSIAPAKEMITNELYGAGLPFRQGFLEGLVQANGIDRDIIKIALPNLGKNTQLFIMDLFISAGIIPQLDTMDEEGELLYVYYLNDVLSKDFRRFISFGEIAPRRGIGVENGKLYHGIRSRKIIPYDGLVYDFMIDRDESFSGPYIIYHNSKGPFAGGRITSWQPSWYTKIKSQYQYTDAALGTRLENLLYTGPLSALGVTDPYHYERCVVRDTPVLTRKGYVPVQEIVRGDEVLTHDGLWKRVEGSWEKPIDEVVVSFYSISVPTTTTVEHRYLVRTPRGRILWERADLLTDHHSMIVPKPVFGNRTILDLAEEMPDLDFDNERVYDKKGFSMARRLQLDERLGFFLGTYISRLRYTSKPFSSKNRQVHTDVYTEMERIFGAQPLKLLRSKVFERFIDAFGVHGKIRVPYGILLCNRTFSLGFLRGIFEGDIPFLGTKDRILSASVLSTLFAFGIYFDVIERKGYLKLVLPPDQKKNMKALLSGKSYQVKSDDHVEFTEDQIFIKVKKVIKEFYAGRIYDLQISGSHSFVGDACTYHNTRFHERPYVLTSPPFSNVPVIGPTLNATVGNIIKPQRMMHEDELKIALGGMDYSETEKISPGFYGPKTSYRPQSYEGMIFAKGRSPTSSLQYSYGESFYRFTEAIGLRGFMVQSLLGGEGPNAYDPKYEDASGITSHAKQFWDMQIGGAAGLSESIRRFYPRSRSLNMVNPIRNVQPTWLPDEFEFGDAIGRLNSGLLLLPSKAYEATHNIKHTFPVALEYIGYEPAEGARRYLQLDRDLVSAHHDDPMRKYVQRSLMRDNSLAGADFPVFDPYNLVQGSADVLVNMGRDIIPMQVKASTAEELSTLSRPADAHVSQLNFIMRQMKKRMGQITYVAYDDPSSARTFTIRYSQERFLKDMNRVNQLREISANMLSRGVGYSGESYSYPDRLVVLANNAPWSAEYKETKKIVGTLQRHGKLDEEDIRKVRMAERMRNSIMRQYDVYPRRFALNQILTPDSEYNLMSENRNIKAASEYSLFERLIGGAWEKFITTKIPFASRFYGVQTPEQAYETSVLEGTTSMWQHPVRDFMAPAYTSFRRSNDPLEASRKAAFAGALFGPPGAALGAGLGFAYGSLSSTLGLNDYIPGRVEKGRALQEYFDAIKYVKGQNLYAQTGDPAYLQEARETIYGLGDDSTASEIYRSVPYKERPFLWSFADIQDEGSRRRILKNVSPTMEKVLKYLWSEKRGQVAVDIGEYTAKHNLPDGEWSGWEPQYPVEDSELVAIRNEGLSAHDFGLGWRSQEIRMKNSPYVPSQTNVSPGSREAAYSPEIVRQSIRSILSSNGLTNPTLSISNTGTDGVVVNIEAEI